MSTPDASVFTRRKRDLAMTNGVPINPIKNRASSFFYTVAGAVSLPNFLSSRIKNRQLPAPAPTQSNDIITLDQPFLAQAEVSVQFGLGSVYLSKVPAKFTADTEGDYSLKQLLPSQPIPLTAGQAIYFMLLNGEGPAVTSLTITKVEAPSNIITLDQPFLAKAEVEIQSGKGPIFVSTVPALFTAPSSGAYSLNYEGRRNTFLQVFEVTTPESFNQEVLRVLPPNEIVILTSDEVLPLMFQSLVQNQEVTVTITQQELITQITKSQHTLINYNDYDWRVSNTPSAFYASRDGVYVLNFDYPSTRVRKVSQNTTPQTTFNDDNESLDYPPINVYLEAGEVFYFMTYYDAQDGQRDTKVIVTRRPAFTGSLVEDQEELIPCKIPVTLNIDQPEVYQTDFVGDYFTTNISFRFEAPRDGQYEMFQPRAKGANYIPLARVLNNTSPITLENHQTEIIEGEGSYNSVFSLTQGQIIYLMPIASTEGEILSVKISEYISDSGPGPDFGGDDDDDF